MPTISGILSGVFIGFSYAILMAAIFKGGINKLRLELMTGWFEPNLGQSWMKMKGWVVGYNVQYSMLREDMV